VWQRSSRPLFGSFGTYPRSNFGSGPKRRRSPSSMLSDPCAYLAPSPSPTSSKHLAPVHGTVVSPGVDPVIRLDPKLPLSVEPARAAVSASSVLVLRATECTEQADHGGTSGSARSRPFRRVRAFCAVCRPSSPETPPRARACRLQWMWLDDSTRVGRHPLPTEFPEEPTLTAANRELTISYDRSRAA
jgi:hypothetical protein